ncbi:MAG: DUF1311 domain-containing protein [Bacteroidia bacterium]|nr:DUF1311 domain-containing protein [Bacteroidia bacterium]
MKSQVLFSIILVSLTITSFAQTQGEMNFTAAKTFQAADKELNQVFQTVLKEHSNDTIFISKIKTAQNLWIKLRDANLDAIFIPGRRYGSVEPLCRYGYLEEFTKERIEFLKTWIDGIDKREACKGTRKTKSEPELQIHK